MNDLETPSHGDTHVPTLPDHLRLMARYNSWMNGRLYDACEKLSDEDRKRDLGAFFGSIHGTLNHLLLTDQVWLARFAGKPPAFTRLDQELYRLFRDLEVERWNTDFRLIEWAAKQTDETLARDLEYTSIVAPAKKRTPLWLAATHLFNHQTHHRGQVTAMLTRLGVDPGVTDLVAMPPDAAARGTFQAP